MVWFGGWWWRLSPDGGLVGDDGVATLLREEPVCGLDFGLVAAESDGGGGLDAHHLATRSVAHDAEHGEREVELFFHAVRDALGEVAAARAERVEHASGAVAREATEDIERTLVFLFHLWCGLVEREQAWRMIRQVERFIFGNRRPGMKSG